MTCTRMHVDPVNTRRYMDVDATYFERYGRQNNIVCLLGNGDFNQSWKVIPSIWNKNHFQN